MSWLHGIQNRLANLFRGDAHDRELAEEISYHLELETARQITRGLTPEAARQRALARFGDTADIRQATRDERGTQTLEAGVQDFRWALRGLRRQFGFTTMAVVTLALGIGAATTAFTVLDGVLLRPLPYRDASRLVSLRERTARGETRPPSYPNFLDWRDQTRSFAGVVSEQYPFPSTALVSGDPVPVMVGGVSRGFFSILGVRLAVGREFTPDEARLGGRPAVVVTHEFWTAQMGARRPLGAIDVGGESAPVVGVLPAGFHLLTDVDVFYANEQSPGTVRSAHNYMVFGRLAPGATLTSARAELATLSQALHARYGNETEAVNVDAEPLQDYLVANYRVMLSLVFAGAVLVLLIACTNLVSAQLARGLARDRELSVRASLGASRGRLVRQLMAESALVAVGGAALGLVFAAACVRVVRLLGAGLIPRLNELAVDGHMLLFAAGAAVVTAVIIGVYPALRLVGRDPSHGLSGTARAPGVSERSRVWPALIGFEIAVGVVLAVGSLLLVRTMHNIVTNDSGLDSHGVVTATFASGGMKPADIEAVRTALASLPGVSGVARSNQYPLAWGSDAAPVLRPGDPPDHDWPAMAGFRTISPDYFSVLRQPLVRGRAFSTADGRATPVVAIVSSALAARLWPGEDPIGKLVRTNYLSDEWLTVVGVVSEATNWRMQRGEQHEIYVPVAQHPTQSTYQTVLLLRTTSAPASLYGAIRARMRARAPATSVRIGTLDDRIEESAADRRFAMTALLVFGAIALILSAAGIYGVMSYAVAQRTREIGVRIALGATPLAVQARLLRTAAAMAAAGVVAGLAGGLVTTRFLQSELFGITATDPWAYAIAAAALFLAALAGAYVPARRSSRISPLEALRAP